MSRAMPTLSEIAERLAVDPPCDTLNASLLRELHAREEYEAVAVIQTTQRMLYECECAILAAVSAS